ncbi:tyrosine-type recombinase/integrase [Methanosarcina hadiensis]|uniref:tyrosine-type recombinase/integrase n=1 Tax=Methanosarcina hadiensis TaxID=3078083 RepID=UPI003977632A
MKQKTKKDYTIIENNIDTIKKYSNWLNNNDYSAETVHNKLVVLHPFFRFLNFKKAKEITKEDIESYFASLRKVKKVNTINVYKIELRFFFNWLKPKNKFFSDITTKKEYNGLNSDDLISEEEAHKIIQATRSTRDRALLHVMYDSAARLDELRNLKKSDVFIDQYGAKIKVNGKTGERSIRIIDSVPDLQTWMNQHTGKQSDYLFPVLPQMTQFSKHGFRNIVKISAKRAGIEKNIHPHLFRHSKLTDLHKRGMTETELKPFAGWTKTSQMAAIYIHLAESDIDDKLVEIYGKKKEKKIEKKSSIKVCPFCKTENTFDTVYCRNCSRIIDQTRAIDPIQERLKELEEKVKEIGKEKKEIPLDTFF